MSKQSHIQAENQPAWYTGRGISEPVFCLDYLCHHRLGYAENSFFTPEGRVVNPEDLHVSIFDMLHPYIDSGVSKKIESIVALLRVMAKTDSLPPQTDRVHVRNGTLFLDGHFSPEKNEIVRSRLPVTYNPNAAPAARWQQFLSELLYAEDIPTLQEFIGYSLIPSNAGQRMLLIKGNGGEGKSQIGTVLAKLFGSSMKNGSVGKVSENRFARADLEHIHLMVDDDMQMDALRQTNYIKSIVTANGLMDLEKKGKQSYQGYLYARILAFSNGDLTSLYDRSDGFFRRQLILTTKPRPADRVDDPLLAEKLCGETEGIFLWAFEGLKRLTANHYRFTESDRARANREMVKRDVNNVELFMESEGYIRREAGRAISSRELVNLYRLWCDENAYLPMRGKTLVEYLVAHQGQLGLKYTNNILNPSGRRVRGFQGIGALISQPSPMLNWSAPTWEERAG